MEKKKIFITPEHTHIWTIHNKQEEKFLRTPVPEFAFSEYDKKSVTALIAHMRKMMVAERGVGLSANQIGLPYRIFVAQLPSKDHKGYTGKFYTLINPQVVSASAKKTADEEGCLSIPNVYGTVERAEKITVQGLDKNGKEVKIKAEGFLARIFQHEIDHLQGVLFIDKARNMFTVNGNDARIGVEGR
jgi:peptide deformylase